MSESKPPTIAKAEEESPLERQPPLHGALRVIGITSVAAMLIGLVAVLFEKLEALGDVIGKYVTGETGEVTGIWTTIIPAAMVFLSMPIIIVIQRRFFPGTEGTGIPQAIAAIRIGPSPTRRLMLSTRIAIGKILLLAIALLAGITVGREGPSVHVGACCMHLCTKVCRVPSWLLERGLILAGGAAGIAAAFNTPVAGAIFCIEEIGRTFDRRSMPAILRTVAIACIVGVVCLGDYLFYGPTNRDAVLPLAWPEGVGFWDWLKSLRPWIAVPVIGVAGGFLGGGFARGVVEGSRKIGSCLANHPLRTGIALGAGLAIIGVVSGGASYGGGHARTMEMLEVAGRTGETTVGWTNPIATAAASFLALVSAIPGGLFDPSLTVGAGLGQVTHDWFTNFISPGIGLRETMLLWMAAYFAGVVRSPLTVAAILFEMTGAYGMILPLMLASMMGSLVAGRLCEPSIYDALASQFLNRLGLTDPEAPKLDQSRSR
ncbi:MAG: chloride channel protein [Planctomycetaceae bacterium]|nr:chloride channel protein [Planctomycetaceae bacterium]